MTTLTELIKNETTSFGDLFNSFEKHCDRISECSPNLNFNDFFRVSGEFCDDTYVHQFPSDAKKRLEGIYNDWGGNSRDMFIPDVLEIKDYIAVTKDGEGIKHLLERDLNIKSGFSEGDLQIIRKFLKFRNNRIRLKTAGMERKWWQGILRDKSNDKDACLEARKRLEWLDDYKKDETLLFVNDGRNDSSTYELSVGSSFFYYGVWRFNPTCGFKKADLLTSIDFDKLEKVINK